MFFLSPVLSRPVLLSVDLCFLFCIFFDYIFFELFKHFGSVC